jgi:hypothetical protein
MLDVNRFGKYGVVDALDKEIFNLGSKINQSIELFCNEDSQKYIDEVQEFVFSSEINEDYLTDVWVSYVSSLDHERVGPSIFLAIFYLLLAKATHGAGLNEQSWFYVVRSWQYASFADGLCSLVATSHSFDRSENSRKAGLARGEKNRFVQDEVARLLTECRPLLGWKNKASAIKEIEPKIRKFIEENRSDTTLSAIALAPTIRRWIDSHEFIKNAYEGS